MYKEFGIIVQTDTFEEGDVICSSINWAQGWETGWFKASADDVEGWSGKGSPYLKLIQNNPIDLLGHKVKRGE